MPATEMLAVRAAPVSEAITRLTEPGPVFDDAPLTVAQVGKPVTDQVQEAGVCTATLKVPPDAGACTDVGDTE